MAYKPLPEQLRSAKPASEHTIAAQENVRRQLDFTNRQSFSDARKGFIATLDPLTIKRDDGHITFDLAHMSFLDDEAPDTVNPSLWRQAQLNAQHHGLYEVCDGLYQVRSFDIANMTLIRGNSGWIVIDPLTSSESSAAALALANQHLGERPVVAVIHTHSHADHFAGVLGVTNHEDAASGKVAVIAPKDFVKESLSENVLAGNAMARRSTYMYGNLLKPSPTGYVTTGLGAALSLGTTGFIVPNDLVCETGETRLIDGIELEFQMTMGTEAPSEFVFYLPQFKALCMSEITSHHLHNVYTPRGAQVRDALAWAAQINESIELFGDRLDIQFASHHWPIWGREAAVEYLENQRDLYKYIHDQTLRLANKGYNKEEIAERVHLPESLNKEFYNRDYYGTVHHNSRAVYVKYLGFFDGNPANLYQLPPTEQAHRYLDYMGGADAVVNKAEASFAAGDYRWVAEVLNHVVMADPEHIAGRALLADTYEQLGYQSESAPWRNFYLCGALELREGLPESRSFNASAGMAAGIPIENLFQIMAVRLLPEEAAAQDMRLLLQFGDLANDYVLQIKNAVLNYFVHKPSMATDAQLSLTSMHFKQMIMGQVNAAELIEQQHLSVDGDLNALLRLGSLFDQFPRRYPLVTPRDP
jgi:alkyl sulfatase BDS1-like metallo-beta-lactamase superfamily hydrolase